MGIPLSGLKCLGNKVSGGNEVRMETSSANLKLGSSSEVRPHPTEVAISVLTKIVAVERFKSWSFWMNELDGVDPSSRGRNHPPRIMYLFSNCSQCGVSASTTFAVPTG